MTSEVTQAALEPCPLCGSRAFFAPHPTGFPVWCIIDRCLRLPPRETKAEAIAAWNTRLSATSGDGLAAQLERIGDDYADGKRQYGDAVNRNLAAAASFHHAAELVKRHMESNSLSALVEGLHAQIFGIHSLGDPALSHASLADGGQIHEAVHAIIRALPARLTAQSGEQQSCEPIATVEMIETVTGDFYTEPGEPIWRVMVGEYCADFDFEQAARNFASAINLAAQSGEGRSGAGEDALARFGHHPDPATDFCIEVTELECIVTDKELGLRDDEEIPLSRIARAMTFRVGEDEIAVGAKQHLREIESRAAALNARQSGEGEREKFLTAYVSEDSKIIGIEHDADADWHKVHDAHIALWNRLEERIRDREKCPRKPAIRATDDARGA